MAEAVADDQIREEIDRRKFRKGINQALWRVLNGEPHCFAAGAEGLNPGQLLRCAMSIEGMREAHWRAWRSNWHAGATPVEWERFLTELCDTATAEEATPTGLRVRRRRA